MTLEHILKLTNLIIRQRVQTGQCRAESSRAEPSVSSTERSLLFVISQVHWLAIWVLVESVCLFVHFNAAVSVMAVQFAR